MTCGAEQMGRASFYDLEGLDCRLNSSPREIRSISEVILMAPLWDFTDLIPAERRTRLLALSSFDDVILTLTTSCKILNYEAEHFLDDRLSGCVRAKFLLHVDFDTYDGFFNSPVGYRAQYCLGSEIGELANRQSSMHLDPKLIKFAQPLTTPTFDSERVARSLDAIDAKIWIDETEDGSGPPRQLEVHINYRLGLNVRSAVTTFSKRSTLEQFVVYSRHMDQGWK